MVEVMKQWKAGGRHLLSAYSEPGMVMLMLHWTQVKTTWETFRCMHTHACFTARLYQNLCRRIQAQFFKSSSKPPSLL